MHSYEELKLNAINLKRYEYHLSNLGLQGGITVDPFLFFLLLEHRILLKYSVLYEILISLREEKEENLGSDEVLEVKSGELSTGLWFALCGQLRTQCLHKGSLQYIEMHDYP